MENIPPGGPYILSSNEISQLGNMYSAMVVARLTFRGVIPELVAFADEFNWTTVWRGLYSRFGAHPILPHGRGQGTVALLQGLTALQQGKVVSMNPEGEMSWDGRLIPPKPAVAWLALRSGAPILLLVTTRGAYDVWPKWAPAPHWTGNFQIRIGKPFRLTDVPLSRVTPEILERGNQRLMQEMNCLIYN